MDAVYDSDSYREKVTRYIKDNVNMHSFFKLTHNLPIDKADYKELKRVFTVELGSIDDYMREFGNIQFGLLVRSIAKIEHEAVMAAFESFINDESINNKQLAFVYKIINHIEQNGYLENIEILRKPPFDKPLSFSKLFDIERRAALMEIIGGIKKNAMVKKHGGI